MSSIEKIKKELDLPNDKIDRGVYRSMQVLPYDMLGQAIQLGMRTWPKDWDNEDLRLLSFQAKTRTSHVERGKQSVDGILSIGAGEWITPDDKLPYAKIRAYILYGYGYLTDPKAPDSFVLEGWSGIGKHGSRGANNDAQSFEQMMNQLQKDGPVYDPDLSLQFTESRGPTMFSSVFLGRAAGIFHHSEPQKTVEPVKKKQDSPLPLRSPQYVAVPVFPPARIPFRPAGLWHLINPKDYDGGM